MNATSDPTHAPSGVQVMAKPLSLVRLIDLVRTCCGDGRGAAPP